MVLFIQSLVFGYQGPMPVTLRECWAMASVTQAATIAKATAVKGKAPAEGVVRVGCILSATPPDTGSRLDAVMPGRL